MAIYLLFIQHIISSLNDEGKAAVVVPTGFLTEGRGRVTNIANKIRKRLVDEGWLRAVVSMPSNIFATTGTNVSIIFIDKTNQTGKAVLVDASSLGTEVKEGKNKKTLLSKEDEQQIINAIKNTIDENGFSAVKTFDEIKNYGGYSYNPGTYFDVQIQYVPISSEDFDSQLHGYNERLVEMFNTSAVIEKAICSGMGGLRFEQN